MRPEEGRRRKEYEQGLDDYHDPTAGFGGAPPARSALTLRAVLAAFGLVFCAGAAWISFASGWSLLTGSAKSSGDTEDHQRAAGVAGVAAECGGDVRGACQAQDADDEVAQGGHDLWSCTGADL